ncbi:hypothetical protein OU415_18615 [Saccharopolyspora sp. WRP15-2]|uniref:Uncharacterized protein n=1 Tax=Saccharopolyspora oryzae TaxID=2997343 RepID=A0ABT4V0H8_9PSEU|nr:hypothetical protein [Saccharopolyspora oryzae]MDA3627462.1 hypothetical protein [Saccharopolyspora oryzae]
MTTTLVGAFDANDESTVPPLTRRPDEPKAPEPLSRLRGAWKALAANPLCERALDDEARSAITFGAVDPSHLKALASVNDGVNLLVHKPVAGGSLYLVGPHRRYLDLLLLPDIINGRWGDTILTAMDPEADGQPPAYSTLHVDDGDGVERPLAILTIRMRDRRALAEAVYDSMVSTYEADSKRRNVYTDSILQEGVKEPLTLFLVRVLFDDGTGETYLVAGDGNSRLISLWLARTGGDIHEAVRACVAAVIGSVDRKSPRRAPELRRTRNAVAAMAERVRAGLAEEPLTEATRREGHTLSFPAMVVVGAVDDDGASMPDLVVGRDDLLSNLHTRVTPWSETAQNSQGMRRVYRNARIAGHVTDSEYEILVGTAGVDDLHSRLGLPPHRLWASAVHQHVLLAGARAVRMTELLRQEFGFGRADRQLVGKRTGALILSPYRSDTIDQALRAFDNGGTITDVVWKRPWHLTKGSDPVGVLDEVLAKALGDDEAAVAELTVLGGTAAILSGLITRDRGSKLGVKPEPLKTPYRATPTRLLTLLASTAGGRRMLHSIACAHVLDHRNVKAFHTRAGEVDGHMVEDGDPVIDKAHAQESIRFEWDLAWRADARLAEETVAATRQELAAVGEGDGELALPLHAKERRNLDSALTSATRAAHALAELSGTDPIGPKVFESWETVSEWKRRLRGIEELLGYGPKKPLEPLTDTMTSVLSQGDEEVEDD